jgi:hypothetical protein
VSSPLQIGLKGLLSGGVCVDTSVPLSQVSGLFWRQYSSRFNPFVPEERARSEGRYHRVGESAVWYGATCEIGAWAELERHSNEDPERITRYLSCVRIRDVRAIDLTDSTVCRAMNPSITWESLCTEDYALCQSIADLAFAERAVDGLLAPSAPLGGHTSLVLRRAVIYNSGRVVEETRRVGRPPAAMVQLRGTIRKREA